MPKGIYKRQTGYRKVEYITLFCEVCNKQMEFAPGVVRQRKTIRFCSLKCMGLANVKPERFTALQCDKCSRDFSKRTDHLTVKNFCSVKCRDEHRLVPGAKWRDAEYIKAYQAAYRVKNKDSVRLVQRNWFSRNKDKKAPVQRSRRFGVKSSAFSANDWAAMKTAYQSTCLCCRKSEPDITLTQDHILAFKNGGKHTAENIQPLCFDCNRKKGIKTVDYRMKAIHGIEIREV